MARVAREAKRQAKREAEADRAAARAGRKAEREQQQAERVQVTILPPLAMPELPPDVSPLDFLQALMRDDGLPLGFRRDCAALALPYAHAKPILGLKDARRDAALLDDGDDEIAAAMRA